MLNCELGVLHATAFARTATVVRDGRDIDDRNDFEADRLEGTDGGIATEAGTADLDDDVLQAMRHGVAGGVLSDDLCGVSCGLTGTAEVALAGAGPGDDLTFGVGDRDDRVVERSEDVCDAGRDVLGTFGLADLDGAKLFLEEIFSRGLFGDTANKFDRLVAMGWCGSLFGSGSLGGLFSNRSFSFGADGGCSFLLGSFLGR